MGYTTFSQISECGVVSLMLVLFAFVGVIPQVAGNSDLAIVGSNLQCNCTLDGVVVYSPEIEVSSCQSAASHTCPQLQGIAVQQLGVSNQILQNPHGLPFHLRTVVNECPDQQSPKPKDCSEISSRTMPSGRYMIYPDDDEDPFPVYCDMSTDGGGWTVIQKRLDGNLGFFRNWLDYKHGFGSVLSSHWIGNDKIHRLTSQKLYKLRVEMSSFDGRTAYALYDMFFVGGETLKYTLYLGEYTNGTAGDSLSYHNGQQFTTKDADNDESPLYNCAAYNKGGWWYKRCHHSNLNGRYFWTPREKIEGLRWKTWLSINYSMRTTAMKIRPI